MSKIKDKIKAELQRFINRVLTHFDLQPTQEPPKEQETQISPPTSEANAHSEEQPQSSIKIDSFGSPNCSKAKEDPSTQIKDFRWSKDQLSYKWAKGNLSNWGIKEPHDASALAIFGYRDSKGNWRFSKQDWISSDRLSRSMENVRSRYNGIDPDAYFASEHHGFFIMDKEGKRRTNILTD